MKRLFLAALGVVLAPNALALPEQTVFSVVMPDQFAAADDTHAGEAFFTLDADLGLEGCRYLVEWNREDDPMLTAQCYVIEQKVRGHASCAVNRMATFVTVIVKAPRIECAVFDGKQQLRNVFALTLSELVTDVPTLIGVVQKTAASQYVDPIELTLYP